MKLRICSDIHTEFMAREQHKIARILDNALISMDDDKETVLIVAGDFGSMHKPNMIKVGMEHLSQRFKTVLYIPGNHEYYGGSLATTKSDISHLLSHLSNVQFGEGKTEIEGVTIHHYTLWTDFDGQDPKTINLAWEMMNDYRHCVGPCGTKHLQPEDTLAEHLKAVERLRQDLNPGDIVVTHHLPSFQSVDPAYTHSALNGAYATDLEYIMKEAKPKLWIHGHTHAPTEYVVDETRVICNPRGYVGQESNKYNRKLVVEV